MKIPTAFLCLCALLAGACTPLEPEKPAPPKAADAALAFVEAWSAEDLDAMSDLIVSESPGWSAFRLERLFEGLEERAQITDVEVALTAAVEEPSAEEFESSEGPYTADVPFELVYGSDAAARPVVLDGELELTLESVEGEWEVLFDRSFLWPGIERASGLEVTHRWPRRGSILDREGRVLAQGRTESRSYPQGSLAGVTVGHVAPLSRKEAEAATFAAARGDLVGASGLELALQDRLAGTPASKLIAVNRRGRELEVLGRRKAVAGRDVKTTLDLDVQRAADGAYGGTTGGAIVMDPTNGDLLAVVSSSGLDPNNYVGVADVAPFNRALSGRYPPGSSLKVMTAAAALEEKVVKESTTLPGPAEYRGVRNFESGAFGTIDFASALKFSVNTVFAQVAMDLGARRLKRYADAFGFNTPPQMPLDAATSSFPLPVDEGDIMWGSIGQAQVLASPLEMATIAATIANRGKRMEPRILVRDDKTGERVVTRKTAATMTRLMETVVQGGTGTGAAISGAQVAGKTGTAEVDVAGERRNHAWFIAFAPSGGPRVAVSVVSEYGGVGGQVAAPLAGRILSAVLPHL